MKVPKTRMLLGIVSFGVLLSAVAALAQTSAQTTNVESAARSAPALQTAPGHYITPTALRGSIQQFLNPGLPAYPDFIAGEAVRSQLSPDGKTLAILCAGQNSLNKTDGTTDTANSTQFIFLFDVGGKNKQSPNLTQVIQQKNAHVGLVFSPDGSTLYAAGGRDDVVYVYGQSRGSWVQTGTIKLGTPLVSVSASVRTPAASVSPPTAQLW